LIFFSIEYKNNNIANAVESAPPEHPTIMFAPEGIFLEIKGKIFSRVLLVIFVVRNNNYVLLSCLGVIC
jgi:uncharacterized integral membrane protein